MAVTVSGFLNILKPPGMSSHDVVGFVRRVLHEKRVGHAGTLDPAAAGVLPIAVGQAARLIEYLEITDKTYRAELKLGVATDSGDDTGEVISRQDFVTILFRYITNQYAIINEDSIDRFPDHRQVADYAEQPMRWATEEGILTGNKAADGKTYLEPRGTTTRAQAAAIFTRFCETPFDYLT